MGRHRKLLIFVLVLVVAATAGVIVYQRIASPARSVLMLPDGDLLIYANLAPLPFVNVGNFIDLDQLPGQSDPQYQDFLKQTNFHAERDLATIAISLRDAVDPNPELSAIFTG